MYGASDVLKAAVVYKTSKLGEVLSNDLQRKAPLGMGQNILSYCGVKSQHWLSTGILIRMEC